MRYILALLTACFLAGCLKVPQEPPSAITTTVFPSAIAKLPDPPPALSEPEKTSSWGIEYRLGKAFAHEADLYRASTCFHRARLLLSMPENQQVPIVRRVQLVHALLLCYNLAGKFSESIQLWEQERASVTIEDQDLARDFVLLLYEAYAHTGREAEKLSLLNVLLPSDPLRQNLPLFATLSSNQPDSFATALTLPSPIPSASLSTLSSSYATQSKDRTTAQALNALLPGAGYCYVGQYKTAATSLVMNALFIAAAIQLFSIHQPAAAIITSSFEAGWYFGGITGAGLAVNTYNQQLREKMAKTFMEQHFLFPLQQVHYQW